MSEEGECLPLADRGPAAGDAPPSFAGGGAAAMLLEMEALLRRLKRLAGAPAEGAGGLLAAARRTVERRRARDRLFGSGFFAEPSWDILLHLFVARLEGREISIAGACIAAPASTATAQRHIAYLVQAGFVLRRAGPDRTHGARLQLSEGCAAMLAELLSES